MSPVLFVVGTECLPLVRRTGVAEIGACLAALKLRHPDLSIFVLLPAYQGLIAGVHHGVVCIPVGPPLTASVVGGWLMDELPVDRQFWIEFSKAAREFILDRAGPEFVVWGLDFSAGELIGSLKNVDCNTIFLTDLLPSRSLIDLWECGVKAASRLQCPTGFWRDWLARELGVRGETFSQGFRERRGWVVPFGFDRSVYDNAMQARSKTEVQHAFGLNENPDAFVSVAIHRFTSNDQKNIGLLAETLPRLLATNPNTQFIVGNCSAATQSDSWIVNRLHSVASSFKGRLSVYETRPIPLRQPEYLTGVDLQIMVSKFEAFGINLIYAGLVGVPSITSRAGVFAEAPFVDGESIFLSHWGEATPRCRAESVERFVTVFRDVVGCYFRDRARWNAIRQNVAYVSEGFTWENLLPRYEELLGL